MSNSKMENGRVKVAVIGAGVIGLSSAYKILQDHHDTTQVTVFYDKSSPDTTGDVSAGWLYPTKVKGNEHQLKRWFDLTCQHLAETFKTDNSMQMGVAPISGFVFDPNDFELGICGHMMREATDTEKDSFLAFDWRKKAKTVYHYTTWTCSCVDYLPWLMAQIERLDGKFVQKLITNFDELSDFDVIVNCTGLGAKHLVPDDTVYPIKGQVYSVIAPWVKHFYFFGDYVYVLPRLHDVVLGGTRDEHDYSQQLEPRQSERIWEQCCEVLPSLKNAKIVSQKFGFRPTREPVRLEMERGPRTGQFIVHSYGHGGSGVTLHWGCAVDVSNVVQNLLQNMDNKNSKL